MKKHLHPLLGAGTSGMNAGLILAAAFAVAVALGCAGCSSKSSTSLSREAALPSRNVSTAAMTPLPFQTSPRLQTIVQQAVADTLQQFAELRLQGDELAVTLVAWPDADPPAWASYRGTEQFYPASVVKAFYLVAAHRWLEDGRMTDTPELRRALRDMIVDSYNEPTGYVLDRLSGTTSGPELPPAEFAVWAAKRNVVNEYFAALGYTRINVSRKTWCEGPYGREKQLSDEPSPNHRNWLTTEASARLLTEIVTGRSVTPERCKQMLTLLERQPFAADANTQSREYVGAALPPGSKLWSKAGWTSEVRHDLAYVELPSGGKYVFAIFTKNHSKDKDIISSVARSLLSGLGEASRQ
ncbi:MAG: class A beta-lactamase-related serine hydrolase [Verrucomicrobiae bacterium]|nr:class A beta-lactamase-related serine hydrolase [Verrucomicrobiae bacterium]